MIETVGCSTGIVAEMAGGAGKCLLVTGPTGVGKTTLIMRVLDLMNPSLNIHGFYTQEMREGGQRVGFQVVSVDGRTRMLASSTLSSPESFRWPSVGKYKVDVASFESIALPELQVRDGTHLFIIDEIGKMELLSSSFFPAVLKVLESNIPLLASIRSPVSGGELTAVTRLKKQPGVSVITLNASNRDFMKQHIYEVISGFLLKHKG